jgi:hypothetical protein
MRNEKSKKKVGTSINWMTKEAVKQIEQPQKPKQLIPNYKQMYGTSGNWKPDYIFKLAHPINKRDKSMETRYTVMKEQNNSFLPDINKKAKYSINNRANKPSSKLNNKTFVVANNYSTLKEDDNETAFEDSGVGYHITRKNSNNQPFVDKFIGKINLMCYDFNGYKARKALSNHSPTEASQLCQKTLSCFSNQSPKPRYHGCSPKQESILQEYKICHETKNTLSKLLMQI